MPGMTELDEDLPESADDSSFGSISDEAFNQLLPSQARGNSGRHWTPVEVARAAARFLVTRSGTRVLDLGCGLGKFCVIGATATDGHFTGVEQRRHLVAIARKMIRRREIARVEVIHANITDVTFGEYEAFYLFNPFEENVLPEMKLDSTVELSPRLFEEYTEHVHAQLNLMPSGTRLATYWCRGGEIPEGYELQQSGFNGSLALWIKR